MIVSELIDKLKEMPQDAKVRVWADHGHVSMPADIVSEMRCYEEYANTYMLEDTIDKDAHPDAWDEGVPFVEIS